MDEVLRAAAFAAHKHRNQRRKDAAATPYINHPIDVAAILSGEAHIDDVHVLQAALLHDTGARTTLAARSSRTLTRRGRGRGRRRRRRVRQSRTRTRPRTSCARTLASACSTHHATTVRAAGPHFRG